MRIIIILLGISLLTSCSSKDKELILGKWYSDDSWFEFQDEKKYSVGRAHIPMKKDMPYVLEPKEKRLTLYTDKESESYYLVYKFKGSDTLVLTNSMNETSRPAIYHRKK